MPTTAMAQSHGKPQVVRGACKLVVDGKTYVDMRSNCPIWLANDGALGAAAGAGFGASE